MPNEHDARGNIDKLLVAAGWVVCDASKANIHAARGVAIREFPLKNGHGYADYLFYIDGKAAGVIEAKKEGVTLTGVETLSDKYTKGLPDGLPKWHNPLLFSYQSTGIETRFTNGMDPEPRSRRLFAFHRPEVLGELLESKNFLDNLCNFSKIGLASHPHWRWTKPRCSPWKIQCWSL